MWVRLICDLSTHNVLVLHLHRAHVALSVDEHVIDQSQWELGLVHVQLLPVEEHLREPGIRMIDSKSRLRLQRLHCKPDSHFVKASLEAGEERFC